MRAIRTLGLACWLLLTGSPLAFAWEAAAIAADEKVLQEADLKSDAEALLDFLRQRTMTPDELKRIEAVIRQMGSNSFAVREKATVELVKRGPVVAELLRSSLNHNDLEIARRAEYCLQRIKEGDYPLDVPAAVVRLLADRKPPGATKVLLDFLPFADNDMVADEVRGSLAQLAVREKKIDQALVKALTDPIPVRRAAAGEALVRAKVQEHRDSVRGLLKDPEPDVRLRVALAMAHMQDRDAIPVLIDLLPTVSLTQAWQAESVLYRLAEENDPPRVSLGKDQAAREKCRDAWANWWKNNQEKVDLARLGEQPQMLGYTVVVLLDMGRVMELDRNKEPRWTIDNLVLPLDVQLLPNKGILVAEYHANRVTQRAQDGSIEWQKEINGPLAAQRLPNGNTFIVTDSQIVEVDRDGGFVINIPAPGNGDERIMKGMKLPNGEIACLTTEPSVVRMDATGKIIHSFSLELSNRLFGGRIDMMPNGRVLVPHNAENKVVEYDANGRVTWEVKIEQPIAAVRLPNGNTLVTSMVPAEGAVEFDRNGARVWQYTANTRVTRALRR